MSTPDEPHPDGLLPGVAMGRYQVVVEVLARGDGNGRRLYLGHPDYPPPSATPETAAGPRLPWPTPAGPRELVGDPSLAAKRITPGEARIMAEEAGLAEGQYRLVPLTPEAP